MRVPSNANRGAGSARAGVGVGGPGKATFRDAPFTPLAFGGAGPPVTFPSQQHSARRQASGGRGVVLSTCGSGRSRDNVRTSPN